MGRKVLGVLFFLLGSLPARSQPQRHEFSPSKAQRSDPVCQALLESIEQRCLKSPAPQDGAFLATTAQKMADARCVERFPDSPLFRLTVEEEAWRKKASPSEGRKLARALSPLHQAVASGSSLPDAVRAIQADPIHFQDATIRVAFQAMLRIAQDPSRSLEPRETAAIAQAILPLTDPIVPLESVCVYAKKRSPYYLRDPRRELLTVALALRLGRLAPAADHRTLDSHNALPVPPDIKAMVRRLSELDPAALNRLKLESYLVASLRSHFPETRFSWDAENHLDGIHSIADAILARVARESASPSYEGKDRLRPAFITSALSPQATVEVVLPGVCETGERGSHIPVLGTWNAQQNKVIPLNVPQDWYYELQEGGKTKEIRNGFYDRKAVYYDEATATTRFVVKIPDSEYEKGDRVAHYLIEAVCDGRKRHLAVEIPLTRGKDTQALTECVKCQTSPRYAEFDRDGVRRGLWMIGPDVRPIGMALQFLRESGFQCGPLLPVDTKSRVLDWSRFSGRGALDYFVRNSHANGYEHDAGLFTMRKKGVEARCQKHGKTSDGKPLLHEVVILGYEKDEGETERMDYTSLRDAFKDAKREHPLLFANISCSNLRQTCFALTHMRDASVEFIPTRNVTYFCHNIDDDAAYALVAGIHRGDTYAGMRKRSRVFEKEQIPLPDEKEYETVMKDGVLRCLAEETAHLREKESQVDWAKRAREWIRRGEVPEGDLADVRQVRETLDTFLPKSQEPERKMIEKLLSSLPPEGVTRARQLQASLREGKPPPPEFLIASLHASDPNAYLLALRSMQDLPPIVWLAALDSVHRNEGVVRFLVPRLAQDEGGREALFERLYREDDSEQKDILVDGLTDAWGSSLIPKLMMLPENKRVSLVNAALRSLSRRGKDLSPEASEILVKAIEREGSEQARHSLYYWLLHFSSTKEWAARKLLALLPSPHEESYADIIYALAERNALPDEVLEKVKKDLPAILNLPNADTLKYVLGAAGRLAREGHGPSRQFLEELLLGNGRASVVGDREKLSALVRAFREMGPQAKPYLERFRKLIEEGHETFYSSQILSRAGKEGLPHLMTLLQSDLAKVPPDDRVGLILDILTALAPHGQDARPVEKELRRLASGPADNRITTLALETLLEIAPQEPATLALLRSLAVSPNSAVKAGAALVLSLYGNRQTDRAIAQKAWEEAIEQSQERLPTNLETWAKKLGKEAIPFLRPILRAPERVGIVPLQLELFDVVDRPLAKQLLQEALNANEPLVRRRALIAIARSAKLSAAFLPELERILANTSSDEELREAARAILRIPDSPSLPPPPPP